MVKSRSPIQPAQEEARLSSSDSAPSDRRGFLRQAAAAGMGSAALGLMLAGGSPHKAEAAGAPGREQIRSDGYTIAVVEAVVGGQSMRQFTLSRADGTVGQVTVAPGDAAHFNVPIGGFDAVATPVYGAWYVPLNDIQNLTQFSTIDIGLHGDDRSSLDMNFRVAPGVTSTQLSILTFVHHAPA